MRVLILINTDARRGAELQGARLAAELQARNIDSDLIALQHTSSGVRLNVSVAGTKRYSVRTLRELRRVSRRADIVVAFGSSTLPACAIALFRGPPFIYRSIGEPAAWSGGRAHRALTAAFLRRARRVAALWPDAAESFTRLYGVESDKLAVIPNARSRDDFRPPSAEEVAQARQKFGLPPDATAIAMASALSAEKRVELALSTVRTRPDLYLLIAGDGPERTVLDKQVSNTPGLAARIRFLGALEDVRPLLWAADAVLLVSRTEGMPGILIEAGMCGIPAVSTSVGAVEWMLRKEVFHGSLVPADPTEEEVNEALSRVLAHRKPPPTFDHPCEWHKTTEAWRDLLGEARSAGQFRSSGLESQRSSRVLVVTTTNARRGAEIDGCRLADDLRSFGLDAAIVALEPASAGVTLDIDVLGSSALAPRTLVQLRRAARSADLVIAYGGTTLPAAAIALMASRTPFVYRSIGDPRAWARGRLQRLRTRLFLARARHVVTLWPGAEASMADLYRVPKRKLSSIQTTRSHEEFAERTPHSRCEARRALGIAGERTVIACIGALAREKRVEVALDAVSRVEGDALLLVVGDGLERSALESRARQLGMTDQVRFVGSVSDVRPVLHACDVVLMTSTTEGMPGVLVEAGLTGVPVVAPSVGGIPWLFEQGVVTGIEVDPVAGSGDYALAIGRTLENSTIRPSRTTRRDPERAAESWRQLVLRHAR